MEGCARGTSPCLQVHALLWLEWMSVVEAEVQLPARKAGSVRNVLCTPVHYLDVFPQPWPVAAKN